MIKRIRKDEMGLKYRHGDFAGILEPGKYIMLPLMGYSVEVYNINLPFVPVKELNVYLWNRKLTEKLEVIDVEDGKIALHFENEHFTEVLGPGKHAFWKGLKEHRFTRVNLNDPQIDSSITQAVLNHEKMIKFIYKFVVGSGEKGLLFIEGKFIELLEPGIHHFWRGIKEVKVRIADMRQLQLNMAGQEIMTADQVTLRVNFVTQYRIVDPVKAFNKINSYEDQLYILMQLILREYIGTLKLDQLLNMKEEIGPFVNSRLSKMAGGWGLEFIHSGIKDIILPGEIREILNNVIEAEKRAQSNIITRREETASTRSLLNTARLMEDNPTLYKLKELEHIERISDKIHNLSVSGSSGLLEQLKDLFSADR
jgi:regulator of protease activity HflC (stomatin/prohibitin superfamily)